MARLETVREMIGRQSEPFTVPGCRVEVVADRDRVELGAHLLHVCAAFDDLVWSGAEGNVAAATLRDAPMEFDPESVNVLATWAARSGVAWAA